MRPGPGSARCGRAARHPTHLLNLADGKKAYTKGPGFESLYGSTEFVNKFNVTNAVYKAPEKIDAYLDPSFYTAK